MRIISVNFSVTSKQKSVNGLEGSVMAALTRCFLHIFCFYFLIFHFHIFHFQIFIRFSKYSRNHSLLVIIHRTQLIKNGHGQFTRRFRATNAFAKFNIWFWGARRFPRVGTQLRRAFKIGLRKKHWTCDIVVNFY